MPFHLVMNMFHHCRSERTSVESGIEGKPSTLAMVAYIRDTKVRPDFYHLCGVLE